MARWFRSLRGRIALVTVAVAMLGVIVTGVISLQLVRQASIDGARTRLATEAAVLSRIPAANSLTQLTDRARLADVTVGVISPAGVASGPATSYLTSRQVRVILRGARLSFTRKTASDSVLVEARKTPAGGAVVLATPLASVAAATAQTQRRIAIALVIVLVAALIASALLARWLSTPLVETARTARRMAAGERGLRVARTTPSEVADVADALATLDAALATSESRQREFLLSISHELRTPITAVRGYGEALADGIVAPDQIAGVGRTLVAETERLNHFVADLLELARLEADDFSIAPGPVDISELLDQVRTAWLGRGAQAGVDVVIAAGGPFPPLTSDVGRVRQILDGLVENALRVAPVGTAITLAGRVVGRMGSAASGIELEVRDAGPGLDAAAQAVAFDRGALRERYRDVRPVGTGLGLSIASRLTERLGASIRVESSPAVGTVFTVTLPLVEG